MMGDIDDENWKNILLENDKDNDGKVNLPKKLNIIYKLKFII